MQVQDKYYGRVHSGNNNSMIEDVEFEPVGKKVVMSVMPKGKYPKDMIHQMSGGNAGDIFMNMVQKNSMAVTGGTIGMFVGMVAAMLLRKSKMFFAIGGILVGGVAGNMAYNMIPKIKSSDKSETNKSKTDGK